MSGRLLSSLLVEAASARPEHAAVDDGHGGAVTYRELDRRARLLATALSGRGVRAGDRVGVLMAKSADAVCGLYGILYRGAAYVPLDGGAPIPRLAYMIRNCGMRVLLADVRQAARLMEADADLPLERLIVLGPSDAGFPAVARIPLDAVSWSETAAVAGPGPIEIGPGDLAYLLYTSGSTGEPKGVMISHANALAFVRWAHDTIGVGEDDRLSSHAPFHFDLSVFDLYVACLARATVVLVPERAALFPVHLAQWIQQQRISVWYSVPSALVRLIEQGRLERVDFAELQKVLFAGEVFAPKYLRAWMRKVPHAAFFNLYGPTETNVCAYYRVTEEPRDDTAVPIGIGASEATLWLRDDDGRLITEPGRVGELWVDGPTVAQGYWSDAERTAARFVTEGALGGGRRVYRTGDLACWDEARQLHFRGRRDHMVKSRGYRIELGEIELAILAHPAVQDACVIPIPDPLVGNRLRACVVCHPGARVDRHGLERHVTARLPHYMLPEEIRFLEALPKTSTGKVDRRRLAGDLGGWVPSG